MADNKSSSRLSELEEKRQQQLDQVRLTEREILDCLVDEKAPVAVAGDDGAHAGPLRELLARVSGQLEKLTAGTATSASSASSSSSSELVAKIDALGKDLQNLVHAAASQDQRHSATHLLVQQMAQHAEAQRQLLAAMDENIGALAGELASGRQQEEAARAEQAQQHLQATGHWQQVVFGSELSQDPATAGLRQELIDRTLAGDAEAANLVGQLLQVQSASAERLPTLLQDLGEAYYAWRPKRSPATEPLEQALVDLVHTRCEAAGTANRIELVRPGDRFENTAHDAKTRGAEVTGVHGWIVLRSNGKVYTRARVSVA